MGRQGFGLLLTVLVIVGVEVLAHFKLIRDPGFLLLVGAMFVTYWSGLRTGLLSIGLIAAYIANVPLMAWTAFSELPPKNRSGLGYVIVLSIFCVPLGLIRNKLRKAATREWDAKDEAEKAIQHRLAVEASLRSAEDMGRLVVESALDAIVAMDSEGTITLWNEQAEQTFGWTSQEAVGRKLHETIIPLEYREAHTLGLKTFLETHEAQIIGKRLELPALTKDGRTIPTELSVVHDRIADRDVFIGFVRDITEQKKMGERLRQAQKMEAIGTLAGGIAHDFNNILTAISGNLMLAQQDASEDHAVQQSLLEIEKATARARYIVRQILTFSRAKEANIQAIDVEKALREGVDILQVALPANIQVELYVEPNLPTIAADYTDLHQILLNLGINAQQAIGNKPGKLEIQANQIVLDQAGAEALPLLTEGSYVRISFGDNGCGMDQETISRVFEPFYTTKPPGEGTGLGLAVVHGIVTRHQGAVTVYSGVDKGTVFHIYFPATASAVIVEEERVIEPIAGHGERILYVDDDDALVLMMTRMLSRLNYKVVGVQDPEEALAIFRNDPNSFDLVITDLSMPHMDGPALVRELHLIRPKVPIIMVTGYIRPHDLEQARNIGISELILKPNTVQEMGETLHRILTEMKAGTRPD